MAKIYYFALADEMRKEDKLNWLRDNPLSKIPFETIKPDKNNNWLNNSDNDFETLLPLISKDKKEESIFNFSTLGVSTNRDEWVYDLNEQNLSNKIEFFTKTYNQLLIEKGNPEKEEKVKWSESLKTIFKKKTQIKFKKELILKGNYRPFVSKWFYAEKNLNDRLTQNHYDIFGESLDKKNLLIGILFGNRLEFSVYSSSIIPNLATFSLDPAKWIPLSIYDKNGERKENITDWALTQFQNHYQNESITKENIFYYVYAVLHTPQYRTKYEQN